MAIRIKAKADADGIIRVKCGDDVIEIDLSDDDWTAHPLPNISNPVDDPYTFHVADPFGTGEIGKIVDQLSLVRNNPVVPDPRIVTFGAQTALDVHDVAQLARGVGSVLPEATLAFDLSAGKP